jgi:hypothetical protein
MVADGDTLFVALGNRRAEAHLDMQPFERAPCRFAQHFREGRQQARARLDQHDARVAGIDAAEIVAQRHVGEFGDGARHLHAGRAAADHHEGEEAPPLFGRGRCFGMLEGHQDAATDAGGVVDILQSGRHALPVVVAEIGVPRAGRDDEMVVSHFAVLDRHGPLLLVDAQDLAQQDALVGRAAQDGADRLRDLRRREARGRDLVKQRLEQVIVAPIDDSDVGDGAGQSMRGTQSTEASADDDDAGAGHGGVHQTGRLAKNRTKPRVRGPNKVSVK